MLLWTLYHSERGESPKCESEMRKNRIAIRKIEVDTPRRDAIIVSFNGQVVLSRGGVEYLPFFYTPICTIDMYMENGYNSDDQDICRQGDRENISPGVFKKTAAIDPTGRTAKTPDARCFRKFGRLTSTSIKSFGTITRRPKRPIQYTDQQTISNLLFDPGQRLLRC